PATAAGAGIGLFVSRQLVDAMGGRMWAQRRRRGGSEFGFSLVAYPFDEDELSSDDGSVNGNESRSDGQLPATPGRTRAGQTSAPPRPPTSHRPDPSRPDLIQLPLRAPLRAALL